MGFTTYDGFAGSSFVSPWYSNGGSVSNGYTVSMGPGNYWAIPGETTYYTSGIGYMDVAALTGSPLMCWDNGNTCVAEATMSGPAIYSLAQSGSSSFFIIDSVGSAITDTVYWAFVAPYPPGGVYPSASFGGLA